MTLSPLSQKVLSNYRKNVKQYDKMEGNLTDNLGNFKFGGVSELVDEHDLGSCAERRRGSSPLFPTTDASGAILRYLVVRCRIFIQG